jgi:hypothetical protein
MRLLALALTASLFLAVAASAQTYIQIGGSVYQIVAILRIDSSVSVSGVYVTAPPGYSIVLQEQDGGYQLVGSSYPAVPGAIYYIVYSQPLPLITTTTTTYTIGGNCTTPGQLVNITFQGTTKIVACVSYTDFARATFVTAVWLNSTVLRVEVFRYYRGSYVRNQTPVSAQVYDISTGATLASGSGVDYVDLPVKSSGPVLVEVSIPGASYLIYKDPPPLPPPQPPSLISSAIPAAVLVSALAIALLGGFMSEYAGGSLSIITAFTIAAIAWLALPSLGIPEALAKSLAVFVAVIGVVAYARSRRD